ncbi:hypothetical protein ACVWXQ_000855 [Bradyrhizobium sp. S3.14.4]
MVFHDELQAENTMHKRITAVRSLPMELRRKSKQWLEERGLKARDSESGHRGRR